MSAVFALSGKARLEMAILEIWNTSRVKGWKLKRSSYLWNVRYKLHISNNCDIDQKVTNALCRAQTHWLRRQYAL